MKEEASKIKAMPTGRAYECSLICNEAGNGFRALSLIFKHDDSFYEYINAESPKKAQKKPTGPGKAKAAASFKNLQNEAKKYFIWSDLVAAKIESRKHGIFVMVSYEKCPTDVIEYLISERN